MPYVTTDSSLPRSLDVQISLSRPQAEVRTELNVLCVACEDLGFLPDANRIRFYSSIEAVETDFAAGTEAHNAALAFFSQTPRATTMAIGQVWMESLPGRIVAAPLTAAELAAVLLVADGSMTITVAGVAKELSGLNFTAATTLAGVAAVIDAALTTATVDASCSVVTLPGGSQRLVIQTDNAGTAATVAYPTVIDDPSPGTFVGGLLNMTLAEGGSLCQGYTHVGIGDELASLQGAAAAAGRNIYGWCLGATLRDVSIQEDAAAWALARTAMLVLTTNDPLAYDPNTTTDLASVIGATGNRRAVCVYHDNAQRYPDVSILAYMLHVNYQIKDSTVTAKFKVLPGVETVQLTETQWSTLQGKGYNTYTAIGNSARTYRDGGSSAEGWWMDTVINLDNFVEDLSVALYNVFLRNKKVPYTRPGQMLLVDACEDVGRQYVFNGTFADREVADTTNKAGFSITPAIQVIPTPISQMSVADRASRIGPPIGMIVQEAGAIHSVAVNVEVVS